MKSPSRIRQLASETAIYGVSSILARAVNFLLFPFYSNVFDPHVYGPVVVIYAAFVFLNILYQYGMEAAYMKFASDADDRKRVFSSASWMLAGTAIVLSVLLAGLQGPAGAVVGLSPEYRYLLYYAAGILLLDTLAVIPYAELRLSNRPWFFGMVRVTNVVVNVTLNLVLILGAGWGIEAVLAANLAASAVTLLLLIPVYGANLRMQFDRPTAANLLRFGLPFVPGGLGYALTERVNIFFLERMPADRVLALYGDQMPEGAVASIQRGDATAAAEFVVGAYGGIIKLAIFMALTVQMFRFAWQPFFLNHARDEDAPALFARVFVLLTAGLLLVLVGVSFFAAELVAFPLPGGRHLIAASYWVGLPVIPVALLGYAFQGWYYHFSAGAYIKQQTRYFVHCTLGGAAVAVLINAVFVPQYGMMAAAWATTASYAVMAGALGLIMRRTYPIPYPWATVTGLIVAAAAAFAIRAAMPGWPVEIVLVLGFAALTWRTARRLKV